jgi:hypothetical protein
LTTKQLGLFDAPAPPVPAADPNVAPGARKRLSRQCRIILMMLRGRPRDGSELAAITHRFGGRLHDLRRVGCVIGCDYRPRTGVSTYTLLHEPEGLT